MNTEDLYRLLRASHVQAQGIVDTVADPMLVLDASLCVQNANRAFFETFGVDRYKTIGQKLYELGNGQWDNPELRSLLSQVIPKSAAVVNFEIEHAFPRLGRRTMLLTARTLFHPDNTAHSMLLVIVDVTDRQRRDAERDVLFAELRHRMKNLLGVTQAIARLTTTRGRSAEEYRDAFLGRFEALVAAQELAYAEPTETGLPALVQRILGPYLGGSGAVAIDPGESVEIDSRIGPALGLVLHELATNAAKYGALSVPEGKVRIGWRVEPATGRLRIDWTESGGPPVTPPRATGFGAELIRSSVTQSLGGTVDLDYAATGLRARIVIPLGYEAAAEAGDAPAQERSGRRG